MKKKIFLAAVVFAALTTFAFTYPKSALRATVDRFLKMSDTGSLLPTYHYLANNTINVGGVNSAGNIDINSPSFTFTAAYEGVYSELTYNGFTSYSGSTYGQLNAGGVTIADTSAGTFGILSTSSTNFTDNSGTSITYGINNIQLVLGASPNYSWTINYPTPTANRTVNFLDEDGNVVLSTTAPTSSSATGEAGQTAYDANYFYWYSGHRWNRAARDTSF